MDDIFQTPTRVSGPTYAYVVLIITDIHLITFKFCLHMCVCVSIRLPVSVCVCVCVYPSACLRVCVCVCTCVGAIYNYVCILGKSFIKYAYMQLHVYLRYS